MKNKGTELCPNCNQEFDFYTNEHYYKCPHCGKITALCSLCDPDTCDCSKCNVLHKFKNGKGE